MSPTIRLLVAAFLLGGWVATARAQEVFNPGNGVTLPTVVREVRPDYTEAAKAEHLQGKVVLGVVVRADGTVGDVTIDESLDRNYGLDDQAVKARRSGRSPGTDDGWRCRARPHRMRFTLK